MAPFSPSNPSIITTRSTWEYFFWTVQSPQVRSTLLSASCPAERQKRGMSACGGAYWAACSLRHPTSSLLMGTDGCRRFPISRSCSKRSASSCILLPSVFSMASSTSSRIFLICVTVRVFGERETQHVKRRLERRPPAGGDDRRSYRKGFGREGLQVLSLGRQGFVLSDGFLFLRSQKESVEEEQAVSSCSLQRGGGRGGVVSVPSSSPRCFCCRGS